MALSAFSQYCCDATIHAQIVRVLYQSKNNGRAQSSQISFSAAECGAVLRAIAIREILERPAFCTHQHGMPEPYVPRGTKKQSSQSPGDAATCKYS